MYLTAKANVSTVWGMPPAIIWHAFMIPANNTAGGYFPFVVGFFFRVFANIPCVEVCPDGAIAAGVGALIRTK